MTELYKGYIYIRFHESYEKYNAFKLGKAENIPDRENGYITSEIKRGYFKFVYEIEYKYPIELLERLLQLEFNKYNIRIDGGKEFFHQDMIPLLEPYFIKNKIKYTLLKKDDIENLFRKKRVRNNFKRSKYALIHYLRTHSKKTFYKPRDYQNTIIHNAVEYYKTNNKGLLVLPCGVGKTLISLWITQELKSKKIVIGVPSKELLEQWENVICSLFENVSYRKVYSGVNVESVIEFLRKYNHCIILTTYSSCYKVNKACKTLSLSFDMKINDECHHLTTKEITFDNDKKKYIKMLEIPTKKQLSLTATLKSFEEMNISEQEKTISNNDTKHFGSIIHKHSLLWAIEQNIVCDYNITTLITEEEKMETLFSRFNIYEDNDKRLFLSAYSSLLSIQKKNTHHVLVYCNNVDNSIKIIKYIDKLLQDNYFENDSLYYSSYYGELNKRERENIIQEFKKHSFGILTCVYCLGEGWDLPLLDGVVFSENMTSNIRIVQSALRAIRKNKNEPFKQCKIILPVLDRDEWLVNEENTDLKKVREVIYQMGLEDETIEQKIKVYRLSIPKEKIYLNKSERGEATLEDFGEYDEELTKRLRLKTLRRSEFYPSYEKAKKILANKKIESKREYYQLCNRDIRLSRDPERTYGSKFKGWIDYFGIERIYYDIETCKDVIRRYLRIHPEWNKERLNLSSLVKKLKELDNSFPPDELWVEYYQVGDLRDIIKIKNLKKKRLIL